MEMNVMVQRVPTLTIHKHCRRGDKWTNTQRHIFNFPFSILNLAKENPLESGFSRYLFTYS